MAKATRSHKKKKKKNDGSALTAPVAALQKSGTPTLRGIEDLDETDRAWSRIVLEPSPAPYVIMILGGLTAGVLVVTKVSALIGYGVFCAIPALWLAHGLHRRRKFITACTERGISTKAARRLLANAPRSKRWYEE